MMDGDGVGLRVEVESKGRKRNPTCESEHCR